MSAGEFLLAATAVLFIGISKAGFGGGTGILATPLMAMALPTRDALGTMLPLLVMCDWISCWFYRGKWQWKPVLFFLPACVIGIIAGSWMLGKIDDLWLKRLLGFICLAFCLIQWNRSRLNAEAASVHPGWTSGSFYGGATGIASTLAHAAGPVFAMYLLPMRLDPRSFVATSVLTFAFVNALKLPGYFSLGIINQQTLWHSLTLVPFLLIGTLLGVWMNKHMIPSVFTKIIYVILFLSGLDLIGVPDWIFGK